MTQLHSYMIACSILRMALNGSVDSQDADDIATIIIEGKDINWDCYSEATKESLYSIIQYTKETKDTHHD